MFSNIIFICTFFFNFIYVNISLFFLKLNLFYNEFNSMIKGDFLLHKFKPAVNKLNSSTKVESTIKKQTEKQTKNVDSIDITNFLTTIKSFNQ